MYDFGKDIPTMSSQQPQPSNAAGSYYLPDFIEDELEDGRVPANEFSDGSFSNRN